MEFLCHVTMIAYTCMEKVCCPWAWPIKSPRRGGGTPYNGLYGEGSPNGVPFSGFKYMKGYRGLTCWSIIILWKGTGKSDIAVRERTLNRLHFLAVKNTRNFLVSDINQWFIHILKVVHLQHAVKIMQLPGFRWCLRFSG